jgi:hypothetical protein
MVAIAADEPHTRGRREPVLDTPPHTNLHLGVPLLQSHPPSIVSARKPKRSRGVEGKRLSKGKETLTC